MAENNALGGTIFPQFVGVGSVVGPTVRAVGNITNGIPSIPRPYLRKAEAERVRPERLHNARVSLVRAMSRKPT